MTPKRPRDPNQLAKSIIDIRRAADADNEYAMIDSTIVAHISTAPALKKRRRRPGWAAPYATSQSPNQSPTIAASVRFSQLTKPPLIAGPRSVPLSVR
jgi:hypothetical protein